MTLGQNVPKLDALHLMDGIEGLRSLPKHSVDMLLTDPPYGTTRNFWCRCRSRSCGRRCAGR